MVQQHWKPPPPTPEESKAFVEDPSPDAYEKLVDRLLASQTLVACEAG